MLQWPHQFSHWQLYHLIGMLDTIYMDIIDTNSYIFKLTLTLTLDTLRYCRDIQFISVIVTLLFPHPDRILHIFVISPFPTIFFLFQNDIFLFIFDFHTVQKFLSLTSTTILSIEIRQRCREPEQEVFGGQRAIMNKEKKKEKSSNKSVI